MSAPVPVGVAPATPIGWYCDAAGSRGGRQVRWQSTKPTQSFNAVHMAGPLAEWHPIFGQPCSGVEAASHEAPRVWPRYAARIVGKWAADAKAGSSPSYYANGAFATECSNLAELLDGLVASAETSDAPYDVITAGEMEGLEAWLLTKMRAAAFFPADAHHLANVTLHMIREVRAFRAANIIAPDDRATKAP